MPFSEAIKLQAKKAAAFHCCWCGRYDVCLEVHHIIPEADGGAGDFDNAVALCPACHTMLGDNPKLRKAIKEKRDYWYEECERQKQIPVFDQVRMERLTSSIVDAVKTETNQMMDEVKGELRNFLESSLPFIPESSRPFAANIGNLLINVADSFTVSANASALVSAVTPTGAEMIQYTLKKTK